MLVLSEDEYGLLHVTVEYPRILVFFFIPKIGEIIALDLRVIMRIKCVLTLVKVF